MARLPIKLLPLIGIILLLSAVGFYLLRTEKEETGKNIPEEKAPTADIGSESFNYSQTDTDKGTRWTIVAERGEKDAEIILLEKFSMRFQKDGLDLELEGNNGRFNRSKNEINLSGELKGKTSNGFIFYTEQMLVQLKENYLKSEEDVTVIGPFFKVTGNGFFINLEKEKLEILKNVISTFDKESLTI